MPQQLHMTSWALHSFICCLLKGSTHRKRFFLEPVEPVGEEELEFCSLEGVLDFLLLLSYDW